jgi:hypothetical protein
MDKRLSGKQHEGFGSVLQAAMDMFKESRITTPKGTRPPAIRVKWTKQRAKVRRRAMVGRKVNRQRLMAAKNRRG